MSSGESFKSKLYRYFFFGWMLEQPDGDLYLRRAVRMRNREVMERWLPHYGKVHALVSALVSALFGLALWAEQQWELDALWVALPACGLGAELCLTLGLVAAFVALRLQAMAGDIDTE